ncbi:hypothetical protein Q604_UNBC18548G0020 [human gut metagenome]|jgi:hypothetical protein|uniref:Uncharacterized protein n=1 Tax=human gut metagenome TaxID=408170 RepID=W1WLY8_9ZZZZ|nr:MAG TPA: zinc-ribbon protein [Caudoviricetes sp.]
MNFYEEEYENNYGMWKTKINKPIRIKNKLCKDLKINGFCFLCGKEYTVDTNNNDVSIIFNSQRSVSYDFNHKKNYRFEAEVSSKCPHCDNVNKIPVSLNLYEEDL